MSDEYYDVLKEVTRKKPINPFLSLTTNEDEFSQYTLHKIENYNELTDRVNLNNIIENNNREYNNTNGIYREYHKEYPSDFYKQLLLQDELKDSDSNEFIDENKLSEYTNQLYNKDVNKDTKSYNLIEFEPEEVLQDRMDYQSDYNLKLLEYGRDKTKYIKYLIGSLEDYNRTKQYKEDRINKIKDIYSKLKELYDKYGDEIGENDDDDELDEHEELSYKDFFINNIIDDVINLKEELELLEDDNEIYNDLDIDTDTDTDDDDDDVTSLENDLDYNINKHIGLFGENIPSRNIEITINKEPVLSKRDIKLRNRIKRSLRDNSLINKRLFIKRSTIKKFNNRYNTTDRNTNRKEYNKLFHIIEEQLQEVEDSEIDNIMGEHSNNNREENVNNGSLVQEVEVEVEDEQPPSPPEYNSDDQYFDKDEATRNKTLDDIYKEIDRVDKVNRQVNKVARNRTINKRLKIDENKSKSGKKFNYAVTTTGRKSIKNDLNLKQDTVNKFFKITK